MKLTHSDAARVAEGRTRQAPARKFSKIAGMALLSLMGLSPMALPAKAMAQDSGPAATRVADTLKSTRLYYSFLRLRTGLGYLSAQVREVRDVPLAVREVGDSGSSALVAKADASPREEFPAALDISTGPGASFRQGRIIAEIGAGAELYCQFASTVNDSTAWYAVYAGGPLSYGFFDIKPYLYAEIRILPDAAGWFEKGISAGYRVYYERFAATNGVYNTNWAYGGSTDPGSPFSNGWYLESGYSARKSYDLISLVSGMPYVSFDNYHSRNVHGSIYAGFKHVISSRASSLASQSHFVFRNPAVTFGLRVDIDLLHTP